MIRNYRIFIAISIWEISITEEVYLYYQWQRNWGIIVEHTIGMSFLNMKVAGYKSGEGMKSCMDWARNN